MEVGGQRHAPTVFTAGKTSVPIVQEAGCAPGRSGQEQKISPSLGFDSRTVQAVASRYTDYIIQPTRCTKPLCVCIYIHAYI